MFTFASAIRIFAVVLIAFVVPETTGQERPEGFRFSGRKRTKTPDNTRKISPAPGIELGLTSGPATIPTELKLLAEKGANAIARQDWDDARKHYLEMVLQAPDNPLAYANLGVAEYQKGNLVAAEGNLKKSIDLNPAIAQNWTTLGLIQFEKGELLLAISSLTRSIHENPNSPQAHLYLAAVTYEYGWVDAAVKQLSRVTELDPNNVEAHFNLALTYASLRPPKLELARRHYFNAIDLGAQASPEIERVLRKTQE